MITDYGDLPSMWIRSLNLPIHTVVGTLSCFAFDKMLSFCALSRVIQLVNGAENLNAGLGLQSPRNFILVLMNGPLEVWYGNLVSALWQ